MTRRFTGRHMTMIMIAFFGTVIAVNVTMAVFATRTFGGTVVDNSYVASQQFNTWLDEARAQAALGWTAEAALTADRRLAIAAAGPDGPLTAARAIAVAKHPLGGEPDLALVMRPSGDGRWTSAQELPAGRWNVHFEIARGADRLRAIEPLR